MRGSRCFRIELHAGGVRSELLRGEQLVFVELWGLGALWIVEIGSPFFGSFVRLFLAPCIDRGVVSCE